jgi:thioredoxin 1
MGEEKDYGSAARGDDDHEIERIRANKMRELAEEMKMAKEGGAKAQAVLDHPVEITDATFVAFVKQHPVVVVDCWAPWCGPCRMVAPILEQLAKEYAGKVVFGKLNVDENPRTATEYAIMAIPTLFIFKNGEPVDVIQGAMPKPHFEAKLKEWL